MDEILIYAKYDINMSIIDIRSNIFLSDTEGYTQIDKYEPIMLLDTESNESDRRYMYAHAENGEYIQMIHGKPLFDDKGIPNFHDNFVEWTEEEKEEKYPIEYTSEKDKQEEQLNQMMMASARVVFLNELPDDEAKDIPLCFDSWSTFADGYSFTEGQRVEYKGGLWKCKKSHKKQASWYSGAEPTLWEQLDKDEHAGTKEDPIPVPDSVTTSGFTYIYGRYYLENGVKYLCKRGGIPDEQAEAMYGQKETLYFPPSALLGQYFEITINAVSLSMSNQYTYIFGEYYDDEGVKYICKDVNALDPKESYGETFTSKFKPKYLVGRYFEVVK